MLRIARIVGVRYPHDIVQRGNNKKKVFLDREDFLKYLSLLERYSTEKEAVILVYCFMSNHFHLLLRPLEGKTLSKVMQGITLCYTQDGLVKSRKSPPLSEPEALPPGQKPLSPSWRTLRAGSWGGA